MKQLYIILTIVCAAAATKCFIEEKKDRPEIHFIHLEEESKESEPEIVAVHVPDNKRKREILSREKSVTTCRTQQDCREDEICFASLQCVKTILENVMKGETSKPNRITYTKNVH